MIFKAQQACFKNQNQLWFADRHHANKDAPARSTGDIQMNKNLHLSLAQCAAEVSPAWGMTQRGSKDTSVSIILSVMFIQTKYKITHHSHFETGKMFSVRCGLFGLGDESAGRPRGY